MPRFTLLFLTVILSAATAAAQPAFRLGVRGGSQLAFTTSQKLSGGSGYNRYYVSPAAIGAWQAGAVLEMSFSKFAWQPAVIFSQKGEKTTVTSYLVGVAGTDRVESTNVTRYNWIEIPLNVVYTPKGDHGIQFFAGTYAAFAVGGQQVSAYTIYSWAGSTTTQTNREPLFASSLSHKQRVDIGANIGVGYRCGPVQAQLGYGFGFSKLFRTTDLADLSYYPGESPTNRVVQLTGTYFFEL